MRPKINCIVVDDEAIAREILEEHLARIESFHVAASCKNALEAFQAVSTQSIDLVFLDINMPDISGLSFARSMSPDLKIIFTTAYREYAVDGFDLKAVDYLLKPISFDRLLQAVNKYLDENRTDQPANAPGPERERGDFIFVRAERRMLKVLFSEILYIESLSDYIKIHLADGSILVTRETLTSIQGRLPAEAFLRVHRSYLVSIQQIDSYSNDTIGIGRHEVPISRGYRDEVLKKLIE